MNYNRLHQSLRETASRPFRSAKCVAAILLAIIWWTHQALGAMNNCVIIAQTGVPQDGVTFTGFEPNVSINDSGVVAFVGQTNGSTTSFETIYTGDGRTPLIAACVTPSSDRDFRPFVQINNSRSVVALDQTVPFNRFLRIWYPPGCFTLIARERASVFSNKLPYDSVALNNTDGDGVYIYKSWTELSIPRLVTFSGRETVLPEDGLLNPVIDDTGQVLLTLQEGGATKVKLYAPDLQSSITIASTERQYSTLGWFPGISDDGLAVAFYGEDSEGPGIFVNYSIGVGRETTRIAGLADGFSGFTALVDRVSVMSNLGDFAVAYRASRAGKSGIYVSRLIQRLRFSPSVIVETGDQVYQDVNRNRQLDSGVDKVLNGPIVALKVYDALNTNGQVAFWALTATGDQGIMVKPLFIFGIDVSHYQNEAGQINWENVRMADKRFVFVKASEGLESNENPDGEKPDQTSYTDVNVQRARAANLLVGVYHLARPNLHPSAAGATGEAVNFLNRARIYIGNGYLPPALDLESSYPPLTSEELSDWSRIWLQYIEQYTGIKPIIYTTRSVLKKLATNLQTYPLWISTDDGNETGTPSEMGTSWPNWMFKQYRFGENGGFIPGGITGHVDLDTFNGYDTDINSLLGPTITGIEGSALQAPVNGVFRFEISAPARSWVAIQASVDGMKWTDLGIVTIINGKGVFSDPDAGNHGQRFYRPKP